MNWLWGNDAASSTLQEIEASVRVLTTASSVPEKRDALINLRAAPESSEACELIGHAIPAIVALLRAAASLEVDLLRSALELLIQLIRIPDSKADLLSDVGGGAAASGAAGGAVAASSGRLSGPGLHGNGAGGSSATATGAAVDGSHSSSPDDGSNTDIKSPALASHHYVQLMHTNMLLERESGIVAALLELLAFTDFYIRYNTIQLLKHIILNGRRSQLQLNILASPISVGRLMVRHQVPSSHHHRHTRVVVLSINQPHMCLCTHV